MILTFKEYTLNEDNKTAPFVKGDKVEYKNMTGVVTDCHWGIVKNRPGIPYEFGWKTFVRFDDGKEQKIVNPDSLKIK